MAKIQVEIGGQLHEVTKERLFELARTGGVSPETRLVYDGKETKVRKVQGIEFLDPDNQFSEQSSHEDLSMQDEEELSPPPPIAVPMPPPTPKPTTVPSVQYEYKCVAAPMILTIASSDPKRQKREEAKCVASYAEIINKECHSNWEFYSMEQVTVLNNPGCLGALLGVKAGNTIYNMLVFRRPT